MAGTYQQNRLEAEILVESALRKRARKPEGRFSVTLALVHVFRDSGKHRTALAPRRADKVWGAVAQLVAQGTLTTTPALAPADLVVLQERARAAWGPQPQARDPAVDMTEMVGSVKAWLEENEELPPNRSTILLRPAKLTQLKNARKKTALSRGGPMAIMAAMVILSARGVAALKNYPNQTRNRGEWTTWIADAIQWMVLRQWLSKDEATESERKAVAAHSHQATPPPTLKVLNLGEGWRSVGTRLVELMGDNVQVTGADRRGRTWTGWQVGTITSEINHDWSDQKTDLLTALSKKASTSVASWGWVTLEPECTLFSAANARNQTIGAAHGKWSQTALNRKNAHPDRLQQEQLLYEEAIGAIKTQLDTLEAHPEVPFSLENPEGSELWELDIMVAAISRNPTWRRVLIDRCAYGREEQKPTYILTNISRWQPKGTTGNGRCRAGKCTGVRMPSGKTKHPKQTMPMTMADVPDRGRKKGGRYQWTKEAVKNALEKPLLQEIMSALPSHPRRGPVRGHQSTEDQAQ